MDARTYETYLRILRDELVPAMGCTEPIAVAYAGAIARRTLGKIPRNVTLAVSGNIIKNVKSVIVPHTGGRKGLKTAVAAGIIYGDARKELEVLSDGSPEQLAELDRFLADTEIEIYQSDIMDPFDIQVYADEAFVRILGTHTHVTDIRLGEQVLVHKPYKPVIRYS